MDAPAARRGGAILTGAGASGISIPRGRWRETVGRGIAADSAVRQQARILPTRCPHTRPMARAVRVATCRGRGRHRRHRSRVGRRQCHRRRHRRRRSGAGAARRRQVARGSRRHNRNRRQLGRRQCQTNCWGKWQRKCCGQWQRNCCGRRLRGAGGGRRRHNRNRHRKWCSPQCGGCGATCRQSCGTGSMRSSWR